jgi:hypothetical protein
MSAFRGKPDAFDGCPPWQLLTVDSGGRRNTLVFEERWSVEDGIPAEDIFYGETEGGDLGPLAAWGVDEFDRPEV